MSKILLIEDRPDRQKSLLDDFSIDISKYEESFLTNIKKEVGNNYINIKEKILSDNLDEFKSYSVVICHRSAFEDETVKAIEKLKNFCMINKIKLVLFSGGISACFYDNSRSSEILLINSRLLYSKNLELFLKNISLHDEINLLILSFGDNWKKNLLLNCLENINYFTSKKKYKNFDLFNEDVNVLSINSLLPLNVSDFNENPEVFIENLKKNIITRILFDD